MFILASRASLVVPFILVTIALSVPINLLNSVNKENPNFYKIYKSINALNTLGEREYARNYSLELNFGIADWKP